MSRNPLRFGRHVVVAVAPKGAADPEVRTLQEAAARVAERVDLFVERFDIEPSSDFSAK